MLSTALPASWPRASDAARQPPSVMRDRRSHGRGSACAGGHQLVRAPCVGVVGVLAHNLIRVLASRPLADDGQVAGVVEVLSSWCAMQPANWVMSTQIASVTPRPSSAASGGNCDSHTE